MWNTLIFSIKSKDLELKQWNDFNGLEIEAFYFISHPEYGNGFMICGDGKEIGFIPNKEIILITFHPGKIIEV